MRPGVNPGGTVSYGGFVDVTDLVSAGGSGTYGVADVQSCTGFGGCFGSWSLTVAYAAADLPPRNTRWVASRKAAVVAAVTHGLLPRQEALDRYGLSEEEFDGWIAAMERHGVRGLRVTAVQNYKQPKIE